MRGYIWICQVHGYMKTLRFVQEGTILLALSLNEREAVILSDVKSAIVVICYSIESDV